MLGQNYVDGKFVDSVSESEFDNLDPCTEESLATFKNTTNEEVDAAYECARKTFHEWRAISRVERAEYMYEVAKLIEERREKLAGIISLETGKNYNESIAEVNEALHMAQYAFSSGRTPQGECLASEISGKDAYMLRKPKGVVAIISPWNFPLAIGAFWCAAPALVEGNTVILKPSEDAPYTSQMALELYHDAGVPPGVINLVHGYVCAHSWHKTCCCEMGSKSAVIVFEDANFELAVSSAVASAFKLSGQRCVSSGRLIVHRDIYDAFADEFARYANQIVTGAPDIIADEFASIPRDIFENVVAGFAAVSASPANSDSYMGPLINRQQIDRVMGYNHMVLEDPKAKVLVEPKYSSPGYFVSPIVYKTEWRDVSYLKNEVFGPHVAIIPFDDISDAVRIYNDTDYGLAVGVVTEDFKKARICRDQCDYGMCYWNGGSIAAESHMAFGGVKKSGNGFPSAARTFRAVTHEVSWTVNHDDTLAFPQGMK